MSWEESIKNVMQRERDKGELLEVRRLCDAAYREGQVAERSLAIEAYRLRCDYLFGNKCMNPSQGKPRTYRACDANCIYVRRYEFELNKLES